MSGETLDQRQVEVSVDNGITYVYHSTYSTAQEACDAVVDLVKRHYPKMHFKRKCFRPAKNNDGTDK